MKKILGVISCFLISSLQFVIGQAFITTWDTSQPGSCPSCIVVPTHPGSTYNYDVDWDNDGNYDTLGITGDFMYDFGTPGDYTIRISGLFPRIYFNQIGDRNKIIDISQWGSNSWSSMERAFYGCNNLNISANDAPDLSNVTRMTQMFRECSELNNSLDHWDVSNVENMDFLFTSCTSFNKDLNSWITSSLNSTRFLFSGATNFNGSVSAWDMSNVTNMESMFSGAESFNGQIDGWQVNNVINMGTMFTGATSFNQPLNNWNVGNVTDMSYMFDGAISFNRNLNNWTLTNGFIISGMFLGAASFNGDVSTWDVSNIELMGALFVDASSFDQDIGEWEFHPNNRFILWGAHGFFENSGMSCENYSNTLIGWADNPNTPDGKNLGPLTGMEYGPGAINARNTLISKGWTFLGDDPGTCQVGDPCPEGTINYNDNVCLQEPTEIFLSWDDSFPPYTVSVFNVDPNNMFTSVEVESNTPNFNYLFTPDLLGTYTIEFIVTDNNGCSIEFPVSFININSLEPPEPFVLEETEICFGQQMTLETICNPGSTYVWECDGMFLDPFPFCSIEIEGDGNGPKEYILFETSPEGCVGEAQVIVNNIPELIIESCHTDTIESNQWLMQLSGGNPPYNVVWTGPTSGDSTFSATTILVDSLSTGQYDFVVFDELSCSAFCEVNVVNDPIDSMRPFVTTWITNNPGVSNNTSIRVPTFPGEIYEYEVDVDYEIGQPFEADFTNQKGDFEYDFGREDTVTLAIRGVFPRIYINNQSGFSNDGDMEKLIRVDQWGDIEWSSMENAFFGCYNLNVFAEDSPDLSHVKSMKRMFYFCRDFNADINDWNVDSIENMNYLFAGASMFNQPLDNWIVSKVDSMYAMFLSARSFNQSVDNWNVSNVKDMSFLFAETQKFNQPLNSWITSNVQSLLATFYSAKAFDQDLNNWDVSQVVSMESLFQRASSFNGNIESWKVDKVRNMNQMFGEASSFNQDIGNWEVNSLEQCFWMFSAAEKFNQDLGSWELQSMQILDRMFNGSGMSCENYSNTLSGWSNNPITPNDLTMEARGMVYNDIGKDGRDILIGTKGWTITQDTFNASCSSPEGLIITVEDKEVRPNSTFWVNVYVTNFDDIVSLQTNFKWDSTIIEFIAVDSFASLTDLNIIKFGVPGQGALDGNVISLSWSDPDFLGKQLIDGTRLFGLQFKALGSSGTETSISYSNEPQPFEVINSSFNTIPLIANSGLVRISGSPCPQDETFQTISICPDSLSTIDLTTFSDQDPNGDGLFGWQGSSDFAFGENRDTIDLGDGCVLIQSLFIDSIPSIQCSPCSTDEIFDTIFVCLDSLSTITIDLLADQDPNGDGMFGWLGDEPFVIGLNEWIEETPDNCMYIQSVVINELPAAQCQPCPDDEMFDVIRVCPDSIDQLTADIMLDQDPNGDGIFGWQGDFMAMFSTLSNQVMVPNGCIYQESVLILPKPSDECLPCPMDEVFDTLYSCIDSVFQIGVEDFIDQDPNEDGIFGWLGIPNFNIGLNETEIVIDERCSYIQRCWIEEKPQDQCIVCPEDEDFGQLTICPDSIEFALFSLSTMDLNDDGIVGWQGSSSIIEGFNEVLITDDNGCSYFQRVEIFFDEALCPQEDPCLFSLEDDLILVEEAGLYAVFVLENDMLSEDYVWSIVGISEEGLLDSLRIDELTGSIRFYAFEGFIDPVSITYEVCTPNCEECQTAELKVVNTAFDDIVPTNTFSPKNSETLQFSNEDLLDSKLWIYNRWGSLIYYSEDYKNDWDAKGYPGGVYFYVLQIRGIELKSSLTILK